MSTVPRVGADIDADHLKGALTDAYRDTRLKHVWIVDGWNVSLTVNRSHLIVRDGIGEHARERSLTRSQRVVKRIVILGGTGMVSIPAVQWCTDVGITLVFLDSAGETYAASFGRAADESRLRRAQAVAQHNGVALRIAQRLIVEKVRGHARVLTTRFEAHDVASTVLDYLDPIEAAPTVDKLREIEARAAAAYFDVWGSTVVATFATRDAGRVPAQWSRPNSRKSPLWKTGRSPRKATDPVNAMLNYAYSLAEIECRIAAAAVGLDPGLGVLHSDVKHRDSLALDLLETLRPAVEEHVLDVLAVRRFRAVDFVETRDGVCRLTESVTHPLAASMRSWAHTVGPIAEDVAHAFGQSSPLAVRVRTPLTGARQRAAQVGPSRARGARRLVPAERVEVPTLQPREALSSSASSTIGSPQGGAAVPLPSCLDCGRALTRRGAKRCGDCETTAVVDRAAARAARGYEGRLAIEARTGVDPTQTDIAKAKRAAANARERALCDAFDREHAGVVFDRDAFAREVLPGLVDLTLSQITRALGVSDSAASRMRRGLLVPHPRHWESLRKATPPPDH